MTRWVKMNSWRKCNSCSCVNNIEYINDHDSPISLKVVNYFSQYVCSLYIFKKVFISVKMSKTIIIWINWENNDE